MTMLRILPILLFAVALAAPVPTRANPQVAATVNQLRAANGLTSLAYSRSLEAVARRHARDMAQNKFFSHRGSDGSNVARRARAHGYSYCFVAENIAMGQRSLGEVMQGWWQSRPHRRNMMKPRVREFALAKAPGDIWVMVLADPGC
ncbi:CAP domain-containing protein [Sulfitobacter sp. D35]|uniref:CAP domain-containing protein n=1 Tax=Sulfitobacter sp. D35 TaxID=3083252 RepID=UPI00296F5E2F|nr:CAP domain-containing protein [Sulfitobacter sp. D35]MDW4499594.1 CAP domain-containing protein [Sulfitobacter sp. D35]